MKMNSLLLSVALTAWPVAALALDTTSFYANGRISQKSVAPDGKPRQALEFSFGVRSYSNTWSIHLTNNDARAGCFEGAVVSEFVFDGVDLFQLDLYREQVKRKPGDVSSVGRVTAVLPDTTPFPNIGPVDRLVWALFCCRDFEASFTRFCSYLVPLRTNVMSKVYTNALGTPFLQKLTIRDRNQDELFDRFVVTAEHANAGSTSAVLPKSARAEFFLMDGTNSAAPKIYRAATIDLTVDRAGRIDTDELQEPPVITQVTRIQDQRFTDRSGRVLYYYETNAQWLSRSAQSSILPAKIPIEPVRRPPSRK